MRLIHTLRGAVTLTVTGAEPERFLNACAWEGIFFWGAEPVDAVTLRVRVHASRRRQAEAVAARLMCQTEGDGGRGAPFLLLRLRRRYGLLVGMALSLLATLTLSQFLLCVEVEGNRTVPTAVILSELRRLGVRPGAFGPGLDEGAIAQEALTGLTDLSWMAINLNGTRARVLVRERVARPELEDARRPADVVAGATGLLTHVETWQGRALAEEGDTVVAGDVVISGWVPIEPPLYSEVTDLGGRAVRAEGRVEARTWRTLTAAIPTEAMVKSPTGREKTRFSLCVLGKRLNFYRNSGISFAEYDKMTRVYTPTLPGGTELPVSLIRETVREVELFSTGICREGTAAMLKERLRERLDALLREGEAVKCEFSSVEENGLWKVRLLAECREEIGRTAEWPSPYEGD